MDARPERALEQEYLAKLGVDELTRQEIDECAERQAKLHRERELDRSQDKVRKARSQAHAIQNVVIAAPRRRR